MRRHPHGLQVRRNKKTASSLSLIGQLDKSEPIRPVLTSYLKTKFGNEKFERQFEAEWYDGREWFEYIKDIDAMSVFSVSSSFSMLRFTFCEHWLQGPETCLAIRKKSITSARKSERTSQLNWKDLRNMKTAFFIQMPSRFGKNAKKGTPVINQSTQWFSKEYRNINMGRNCF